LSLPLSTVISHWLWNPCVCVERSASILRTARPPPISGAVSNQVAGPGEKPASSVKLPVSGVPSRSNHCPRMQPLHCAYPFWIASTRLFTSTPSPKTLRSSSARGPQRTPLPSKTITRRWSGWPSAWIVPANAAPPPTSRATVSSMGLYMSNVAPDGARVVPNGLPESSTGPMN